MMSSEKEASVSADTAAVPSGAQPLALVDLGHEDEQVQDEMDMNLFRERNVSTSKEDVKDVSGCDLNNQLELFRKQWHSELRNTPEATEQQTATPDSREEQAKALYLQGMEMEENHMLMEAIYYYKKALHLVPDIESRLGPLFSQNPRDRVRQDSESSCEGEIDDNLVIHFENLCMSDSAICQPGYEQRAAHMSVLPIELVMYILQWVVSGNLDLRSLESVSQVCRGLYLCARDEQIWKMACDRVWGLSLGSCKKYGGSWRRMMIERPHPYFDGCYISRMTYIRQGEQNMDQFYRPYHFVQYYRYVRLFPDGVVMMLVSADEPAQSLPKLRHKTNRLAGLMVGDYKLKDMRVTCVMKRVKVEQQYNYRYKRQRRGAGQNEADMSFYTEFELSSHKKRPNAKLMWTNYTSCSFNKSTGEEKLSHFELSKSSFPPMVFSHVTSFSSASTEPLV